jgi:lysophospholipase L1-like esterase
MHRVKISASLLALALLMAGAAYGQANFSKYVAFGDSLTAGFSSGSINATYQVNSYPALLAKQFGIASFQQPLVSPPGLPGILQLVRLVPTPVIAPTAGSGTPTNLTYPFPYDNMAVPGATVHDLLTKTRSTSANDPTDLILRQAGFTQLQQGLSLHPTFVTLWIGNNDALGSATAGTDQLLTPLASFEADYRTIVGAIAANTGNPKIALANIPDVTSIPFVTTLTRFIPNPATGQPAVIGGNFVPLIGPDGPLQPGDFVLLTATAELAVGHGIPVALGGAGVPLSNSVVLNASEAANIRARVNAYNAVIQAVANERGAALVDVNSQLTELATTGVDVGGITYTSAFLRGGVFSYDGVHPTRFGYAFIANLFIDAINQKFGNTVEEVNLFPFVFGQSTAASASSSALVSGESKFGPPFIFTEEAKRSLLLSLGVPRAYIDGTPGAPAPKPRRPVHSTHR